MRNKSFVILILLVLCCQLVPFSFFDKSYAEFKLVEKDLNALEEFSNKSDWGTSTLVDSKYDNYVLIIGESVRQDYLHGYGYPIENTPFMSHSNGVLVDGLYASAEYTIGSLSLMLTESDIEKWTPNYQLNVINMVKSAGVKTYWLSNQGFFGKYDTPIAGIAKNSDVKYFLKSGSYSSKNTSDFNLLPIFEKMVKKEESRKRFFVLHLYGSHSNACDRVKDYPLILDKNILPKQYSYINCYISSIKKTDEFLSRVYSILKNTGKSFSMIYFSDHGLEHKKTGEVIYLGHNRALKRAKEYYKVPLFKVSSDDNRRQVIKSFKSGLNFTEGLANWIGIKKPKIDPNKQLFSGKDDPTDYGQRKDRISNNLEDKAINISIEK